MTHYDRLGVARGADPVEVRRAYLARARRSHPDLVTDADRRRAAELEMQQLNEAWAVLGDAGRRRAYDRSLGVEEAPQVAHRPWVPHEPDDPEEIDPRDLLDDTPYDRGTHVPRALQVIPPLLVFGALGAIVVGAVTAIPGLLVLGLVGGAVGLALFVVVPFLAMVRGPRLAGRIDDRSGSDGGNAAG